MWQSLAGALVAWLLLADGVMAQSSQSTVGTRCIGSDADSKDPKDREGICLKELGDRAQRSGNTLTLGLEGGKTKVFRSDPDACARDDAAHCANYYLAGFLPSARRYLVYATYYEGFECKLVSASTGKATTLRNIPHFAPDGSTFFVPGYDGSYDNWLSVGSVISDPPAITWEMGPNVYESWEFVRWIDNDRVALRDTGSNEKCPDGNCEAVLRREAKAWRLERLPPNPRSK